MKRKDLVQAKAALEAVKGFTGMKFRYAHFKNMKMIGAELEACQELAKPSPEYLVYDQTLYNFKITHAKKTEDGQPIIENNRFIMENMEKFLEELSALNEANKDVIAAFNTQQAEAEQFMEGETEIAFHMLANEDVPAEITAEQFGAISFMISE